MLKLFRIPPELYNDYRILKRCIADMFRSKGIRTLDIHFKCAFEALIKINEHLRERINDNN